MSTYDNTNSGAIFKNEKKTSENQPDYRGKINVDGVDKEIALWIRTSKEGGKQFFSAKISEVYVKPENIASEVSNDDLPF